MAPFGDVAQALVACRAAARGAGVEVVGPLALEAVGRLVPIEGSLWAEVDVAGGGAASSAAHPGPVDDAVVGRFAAHVAGHRAFGAEGSETGGGAGGPDRGGPTVHDVGDGHDVCLVLPAPSGHRAGIALCRSTPLTPAEQARVEAVGPVLACALLAAGRTPPVGRDVLTAREVAVLGTVATGMSDKQAARHLGVSPRTVGKHLEHIYAKLGVAGRTEAARVWSQR